MVFNVTSREQSCRGSRRQWIWSVTKNQPESSVKHSLIISQCNCEKDQEGRDTGSEQTSPGTNTFVSHWNFYWWRSESPGVLNVLQGHIEKWRETIQRPRPSEAACEDCVTAMQLVCPISKALSNMSSSSWDSKTPTGGPFMTQPIPRFTAHR